MDHPAVCARTSVLARFRNTLHGYFRVLEFRCLISVYEAEVVPPEERNRNRRCHHVFSTRRRQWTNEINLYLCAGCYHRVVCDINRSLSRPRRSGTASRARPRRLGDLSSCRGHAGKTRFRKLLSPPPCAGKPCVPEDFGNRHAD